jgi:predicted small lipoprotein YifL
MRNVFPSLLISTAIALTLAGCARNEAAESASAAAATPPPQVSVAQVVQRPVNEFD